LIFIHFIDATTYPNISLISPSSLISNATSTSSSSSLFDVLYVPNFHKRNLQMMINSFYSTKRIKFSSASFLSFFGSDFLFSKISPNDNSFDQEESPNFSTLNPHQNEFIRDQHLMFQLLIQSTTTSKLHLYCPISSSSSNLQFPHFLSHLISKDVLDMLNCRDMILDHQLPKKK